jgi:hypothetical protein
LGRVLLAVFIELFFLDTVALIAEAEAAPKVPLHVRPRDAPVASITGIDGKHIIQPTMSADYLVMPA